MPFTAAKIGAVQGSVIVVVSGRRGAGSWRLGSSVCADMVFDQVAVRGSRRRLPITHRSKMPADAVAHEGLDLGGRHAGNAACFGPSNSAGSPATHNTGCARRACSNASGSSGCRGRRRATSQKGRRASEPNMPGDGRWRRGLHSLK
jgi:hypothetical protein